jgi:hypothetical protein
MLLQPNPLLLGAASCKPKALLLPSFCRMVHRHLRFINMLTTPPYTQARLLGFRCSWIKPSSRSVRPVVAK